MIRLLGIVRLSQVKHTTLPSLPPFNGYCLMCTTSTSSYSSLTLNYLQNSCGLSSESAISASKKLQFDSTENPDKVLNLLRTHRFTQTQIKDLIALRPGLLLADLDNTLNPNLELFMSLGISGSSLAEMVLKNPRILETDAKTVVELFREHGFSDERISFLTTKRPSLFSSCAPNILKPKLEFLKSLGLKDGEVARILSSQPYLLERSLDNYIMPNIRFLRDALGNHEDVLRVIKRHCPILEYNLEKVVEHNKSFLLKQGISEPFIWKLFLLCPKSLVLATDRLGEVIREVKKLGFDPSTKLFILTARSMAAMSKRNWEKKLETFRSCGLSEEEVHMAIKALPMCMCSSEKKVRKLVAFVKNKLNAEPSLISRFPGLLMLSLEKRIIPRCSVLQILSLRGLIRMPLSLRSVLTIKEENFTEKFVNKYQHIVPEVVKANQGKIEFQGFPRGLKLHVGSIPLNE